MQSDIKKGVLVITMTYISGSHIGFWGWSWCKVFNFLSQNLKYIYFFLLEMKNESASFYRSWSTDGSECFVLFSCSLSMKSSCPLSKIVIALEPFHIVSLCNPNWFLKKIGYPGFSLKVAPSFLKQNNRMGLQGF